MKILVTGSNGQLGQTIMNSVHLEEHEFVFTARAAHSGRNNVMQLDITDAEAVMRTVRDNGIELIINCAGYTDVAKAETEQDAAFRINSDAVACLAEAARENGALLIHISTDYIFDGKSSVPYVEEDEASPLNVYGRSKLAGEKVLMESGCRYLIIRTSWLFSRYGKNFLKTILDKSEKQSVLNVVADQTGTPTYAPDLVDAVFHIIGKLPSDSGIYNYSNEGVCSWFDFASEICRAAGRSCIVQPCRTADYPSNVVRPEYSVLDKKKIKADFSLKIPHWKDSVSLCVTEIEKFG